jgi:hypothetical protein
LIARQAPGDQWLFGRAIGSCDAQAGATLSMLDTVCCGLGRSAHNVFDVFRKRQPSWTKCPLLRTDYQTLIVATDACNFRSLDTSEIVPLGR